MNKSGARSVSDFNTHGSTADPLSGHLAAGADDVGDGAGVGAGLVVGHVLQGKEAAKLAEFRLLCTRPDNRGGSWSCLIRRSNDVIRRLLLLLLLL